MKRTLTVVLILFGFLTIFELANAAGSAVPEPFQRFDDNSKYTINYDDLTNLLKTVVVDVGRSTREKAAPSQAELGTRMTNKVKRSTANEGNRFYYETFDNNEEAQQFLEAIQKSLEQLPTEAPLEYFSRDEQLAYWLNLYNVTILNEIIKVYPQRNLKKLLVGKKSVLSKKILNVAGIPLSLDDIQYTILKNNYDNDPLIIYGLYQGIIGGPNIRKKAYTGPDVRRALKNNANEFINSNRGTYSKDEKVFRVSSLYDRNRVFFPDFKSDLSSHLLTYVEGPERTELQSASTLKPDINDWSVTDLGGTYRDLGGAFARSNAALLDSVKSTSTVDGVVMGAAVGAGSSSMAAKAKPMQRIDPELLTILLELNLKREATNYEKANVTMEELGEVPVDSDPDSNPDSEPERKDNN
ncbi:MAG: DUF547 domain-containing protein [Lysobacterales bacterium]